MEMSVNVETHYQTFERFKGSIIDEFGPFVILALENGSRTVIARENWY